MCPYDQDRSHDTDNPNAEDEPGWEVFHPDNAEQAEPEPGDFWFDDPLADDPVAKNQGGD